MSEVTQATKIVIPCRFSYPNVFQPKAAPGSETQKYSCSLLIDKDPELKKKIDAAIKAAITEGISKKWGGTKPKTLKLPLRDGDEKLDDPNYEGKYFINANNTMAPGVVGPDKMPIVDPNEFYAGCHGYASITFYAFDAQMNKGVAASLNNVMKTAEGERLGATISSAEDDFADIEVDDLL